MERLEDCLSFVIGKAAQQVTRVSRDALAPHGVTPTQFAILKLLWEHDGLKGAELCARLVLDSATVTGLIDRMVTGGWLERRSDPSGDRRVSRVYLTPKGAALDKPLNAVMDAVNAQFVAAMGPERAAVLWRELREIAGAVARDQ